MMLPSSVFHVGLIGAYALLCNPFSSNLSSSLSAVTAFVPNVHPSLRTHQSIVSSLRAAASETPMSNKSILVISPEGGLGEVTAVEAAKLGASVKWFIIQPSSTNAQSAVSFNAPTLARFAETGGNIQLASSDASALLQMDDSQSIEALCTWAGTSIDGLVCTWDHPLFTDKDDAVMMEEQNNFKEGSDKGKQKEQRDLIDAIKVAVQQVSSTNMLQQGMRVALLPTMAKMNLYEGEGSQDTNTKKEGPLAFFIPNNNANKMNVPSTLQSAISDNGKYPVATLRYGSLFGTPSSSPDVSPFIGGLRKDPILREEYTMRSIRIDSSTSTVGNNMYSSGSSSNMAASSRLSVGEAAARLVTLSGNNKEDLAVLRTNVDISLTSLKGLTALTNEEWKDEWTRLSEELLEERQGITVRQDGYISNTQKVLIYKTSFGAVPSKERLAEWIETKWAPTILRSYDIAGIRVGARPVYASRRSNQTDMVEIIWQDLRDFQTILVGRMEIQIMDTGMMAYRTGPSLNEAAPSSPLSGEDILVRRLADASAQAIEKGLATKPAPKKTVVAVEKSSTTTTATTMTSSGTVEDKQVVTTPRPTSTTTLPLPESGPRTVGTRRSSERARGSSKGKEEEDEKESSSPTKSSWQ